MKSIWKPIKMKNIEPKEIVTEVHHRGTFIGGEQETTPQMTLPPKEWKPWTK